MLREKKRSKFVQYRVAVAGDYTRFSQLLTQELRNKTQNHMYNFVFPMYLYICFPSLLVICLICI